MSQVRVNLLTAVNADAVKIERKQIDGEDYAVIRDVIWHKDDIVLNGGLYCAAENEKGFQSMEGRIMPFGHPQANGKFVAISSLDSPDASMALAKHYGGVHAQNVRKEGSNYLTDVMVNERLANAHKQGKLLMDWVGDVQDYTGGGKDKPSPVHMSTGVIANKLMNNGQSSGKNYSWIALNQRYDHLAILFNEQGAGGDEIALAVNCDLVINSNLDEAVPVKESKGFVERMLERLFGNAQAVLKDSYGQRRDVLNAALTERFGGKDTYVYVMDFDGQVAVFETNTGTFSIGYSVEGANVILAEGEPQKVVEQTEFVKKDDELDLFKNRVESSPVSKQNSNPSELPMDKAELEGIIAAAIKPLGEQLTAVNTRLEEVQGENKALKDQLQANTKAADDENRAVILAKAPGLELTVNALSGEALAKLAATYQTAAPLVPGFHLNKQTEGDLSDYQGV